MSDRPADDNEELEEAVPNQKQIKADGLAANKKATEGKVLIASHFQDKVNQIFKIDPTHFMDEDDDSDCCNMELIECSERERLGFENETRAPFSLIFRAHRELCVGQQIFTLKHGSMEDLKIFLVPIGLEEDDEKKDEHKHRLYQAVFS